MGRKIIRNVEIVTPQFTRPANWTPPQSAPADFEVLRKMSASALRELGLRPWGRREDADGNEIAGETLYLFPGEWYWSIPAGFEVVDIFFETEKFVPGRTDNDIRFGCLSFGILVQE